MSLVTGLTVNACQTPSLPRPLQASLSGQEIHTYEQHPLRAGLLVTESFEKATQRCKAKVEEIAAECLIQNIRFRDPGFDLENDKERCLHGLSTLPSERFTPSDVLRVHQIFEAPQFFIGSPQYSDIEQGDIADCWFLSALTTLTSIPDAIEKICVARDEQVGVYGFIFFRDGEWEEVIIDDQLYVNAQKYERLFFTTRKLYRNDPNIYNKLARRGRGALYFAKSRQENETWVPLLEKAYAKFHGDYASIDFGHANEALEDLTGGVAQVFFTNDIMNRDKFWREELSRTGKDRLFGCHIARYPDEFPVTVNGVVDSHAYSVVATAEYKGKRFVKMRNPYGKSDWKGRWSDRSKDWTKEWRGALELLDHSFGKNDAFIMEYEDLMETWNVMERVHLFDDSWVQSSHWLNVQTRPLVSAWQFGDVSFTFTLSKSSPATIILAQPDMRFFQELSGPPWWTFDFILYKRDSPHILGRSCLPLVKHSRSVNLRRDLEAGDYVVHVRLNSFPGYTDESVEDLVKRQRWDKRKLSRVYSEFARSKSLASNVDPKRYSDYLTVSPETFTGRDLLQIGLDSFEKASAEQKLVRDRFSRRPKALAECLEKTITLGDDKSSIGSRNTAGAAEAFQQSHHTKDIPSHENDEGRHPSEPLLDARRTDAGRLTRPKHLCSICGEDAMGANGRHDEDSAFFKGHPSGPSPADKPRNHLSSNINRPTVSEPPAVHPEVCCKGCRVVPIVGIRWVCMICIEYDLCNACYASGGHPAHHQMVPVAIPDDAKALKYSSRRRRYEIVLGLRVYTKKGAQVDIKGQLRHGKLISWKKT